MKVIKKMFSFETKFDFWIAFKNLLSSTCSQYWAERENITLNFTAFREIIEKSGIFMAHLQKKKTNNNINLPQT